MKYIALGLAFLIELVAFVSFSCLGLFINTSRLFHIVVVICLFVAITLFWNLFMAPRAPHKFRIRFYYLTKLVIYALASYVLLHTLNSIWCAVFIICALVDDVTLYRHHLS
jgi:hypothetical protein